MMTSNRDAHGAHDVMKGWGDYMEIKTYDFLDRTIVTQIADEKPEDIRMIAGRVLSGDEVVDIHFADGKKVHIDPGGRWEDLYDGDYLLTEPEDIDRWLAFKPTEGRTSSYQREEMF